MKRAFKDACNKRFGTQRGVTLFMALIVLSALTLASIAVMRSVDTGNLVTGNMAFQMGAVSANDAGIEAASQKLLYLATSGLTDTSSSAHYYSANYDPALREPAALAGAPMSLTNIQGTGNDAKYWLERMCRNTGPANATHCVLQPGRDTPYYRATVSVTGPRNTVVVTQTTIETPGNFVPEHALITEKALQLSSTITVGGAAGHVHSNTHVNMSGSTTLTLVGGTVSAVGPPNAATPSGVVNSGAFAGGISNNAPTKTIPEFNPTSFKQYADFTLHRDGQVSNHDGDILMTAAQGQAGTKWLGWKYTPPGVGAAGAVEEPGTPPTAAGINRLATWELLDDSSWSSGLLYVEGHAYVASSPGTTGDPAKGPSPWVISILATGNIRINNANIQDYRSEQFLRWATKSAPPTAYSPVPNPYDNPTAPARPAWTNGITVVPIGVQNLFLVAGLDLKFDGTVNQVGPEALMTAREQMSISGTTTLRGSVMVADKYAISSFLTQDQVSGTTSITYSGNLLTPMITGDPRRTAWRQMVQR
jgi:type IV pilus assembly protein PilX